MEELVACARCGRTRPASSNSTLKGGCPFCLLSFALTDDDFSLPADGPSPAPPRRIGPYLILASLGAGGMGAVYQARHEGLNRVVALKLLRPEFASRPGFPERFQREGQLLAAMSHPHIIGVHDVGCEGGTYYLAMEYIAGANLRARLERGRLPVDEAVKIFAQICEGLQYAHARGVVHRDIKPENLLLDEHGAVKIADFGIAKLLDLSLSSGARTATNTMIGTRSYMAPEQLEPGKAVDHRADIYSLGVVFYEMLVGELPLGVFAPPSRKAAVDAQLDSPILQALAKDAKDRPQSTASFRKLVTKSLSSPSASAPRRTSRRQYWAALTILASLATLLLAMHRVNLHTPTPIAQGDASERQTIVLSHGARVWDVAFVPQTSQLATAGEDGLVKFWNPSGGQPVSSLMAYPQAMLGYLRLAFSPDGTMLATAGGESLARLWTLPRGKSPPVLKQLLKGHGREIVALAFSPDGKLLATASHDRTARLWSTEDGHLVATLAGATDPLLCVAFSPDGSTVAAGAMNGGVRFWDLAGKSRQLSAGHAKRIWSIVFARQGDLLVTASHDQTVKLGDPSKKRVQHTWDAGSEVWSAAISPDGKIVACGTQDGRVLAWNAADGRQLADRMLHSAPVVSVAFSRAGDKLATASLDGAAKLTDCPALTRRNTSATAP